MFFFRKLQNYWVSIPAKYLFSDTTWIDSWKSNRMSEKNIENITQPDSNLDTNIVATA